MKMKHLEKTVTISILMLIALFFLHGCALYFTTYSVYKRNLPALTSDMRRLETALESYFIDFSHYPAMENDYSIPKTLTTPVAYVITADFKDRLHESNEESLRYYYKKNSINWVMQSCGPDQDYDLNETVYFNAMKGSLNGQKGTSLLNSYEYDPTNGIKSSGDVLWLPYYLR